MTDVSPVTPDEQAIAVRTLMAARDAARANQRTAWSEGLDSENHWSGVAGWLKHRADRIAAGEEPDWPDAARETFAVPVGTGMEKVGRSYPGADTSAPDDHGVVPNLGFSR